MEKMVRGNIPHMKRYRVSNWKQFGFVSRRSTVLHLIKVLDNWTDALNEGQTIKVTHFDFTKAFDVVPSERFVEK